MSRVNVGIASSFLYFRYPPLYLSASAMFSGQSGPLLAPPPPAPLFWSSPAASCCDQLGRLTLTPAAPQPFLMPPPPRQQQELLLPVPPQQSCSGSRVQVRFVWSQNLKEELSLIRSLLPRYSLLSIDTEFPGTIHDSNRPYHLRTPQERYALVKKNVDLLHLIQFGLTLCDADGQLPDLGTNGAVNYIWEFNFKDFDIYRDKYAADSIALLKSQGLDFYLLREFGIDSGDFANQFFSCGLALCGLDLTWISFCGSYDFAYLVKILAGAQALPEKLEDFLEMVAVLFGRKVFDVKHLAKFCGDGIRGGLEHVASALDVERVGDAHNAGSDSLLTCDTFLKMEEDFFGPDGPAVHAGAIDGFV